MSTQKIIFTFLIVFFSLFFIVSTTYNFSTSQEIKVQKIQQNQVGISEIISSSGSYEFISVSDPTKFLPGKNYQDHLNFTDTVYIYGTGYSRSIMGNNIMFRIKNGGLALFDLYDISNNYTINGENFQIKVKSPGKILVDSREKNIKIFSLSCVFSIGLLYEGMEMTTLALHPKMFFSFNESRNRILKNADLLRLETLTNILYLNEEILGENNKINFNFLKTIGYTQNKEVLSFLTTIFPILFSKENISKYNENQIKNNLISIKNITGFDYIDKYFLLFLNDQKKTTYYKKKIIAQLNNGFIKQNILQSSELLSDIEAFQLLNEEEFQKFLPLLYHYYDMYLKINSLDYIQNTAILSDIIMKINGNKKEVLKSYFYLNKIYSLVNNQTFKNTDLQENFLEFLKLYFDEKNISLNTGLLLDIKDTKMLGELEYVSLFIKNILLQDITFSNNLKLKNVFDIFKIYHSINENINAMKNNSKSETIIIENNLIIEKILTEMKNNFFEKERNEKGLLVLKKDNILNIQLINDLNTTIKIFFKFYNEKKGSLSEKNHIYNSKYTQHNTLFAQYVSALSNYSEYEIKYNQMTKELFDTKTILENKQDIILSKEKLFDFLSQFQGVQTSDFQYTIIGKNYYKISNININGNVFSFHLYPKDFHKISNIYINGEKISQTYELDSIKNDLEKASQGVSETELYKYDFKKFFINTFFSSDITENKKFIEDEIIISEPKHIQIFKRDKLLGNKGEFALLKGYLDLKYNDIEVIEKKESYDILLHSAILRTTIQMGNRSVPVIAGMNAKYIFSSTDHYFKDITLQFYSPEMFDYGEKVYMFEGKKFTLGKNINIVDFKKEMDSIIRVYFTNN